jgi:hypothetical protein
MPRELDREGCAMADVFLRAAPGVVQPRVDERAARRSLLDQIAKLESDLASLFCSAYPRTGFDWSVPSGGGPRILTLGELETMRDALAERLERNRHELSDRTVVEEHNRRLIEEMLLEPEKHRWVRVGNCDIGEPGCKHWHVRPRLGLLGMLMGWWRVRISSGCPLARGRGAGRDPEIPRHERPIQWGGVAASG